MSENELSKEHQIMIVMRKVLSSIIKDVTPPPGMQHPLSEQTIADVRNCLGLITSREKELMEQADQTAGKPYFADEFQPGKVVSINDLASSGKKSDES